MPGSSVSACHMCHMHSHNPDGLVRTNPLRTSRGKYKKTSRHSHSRGYSSDVEDVHGGIRRSHSNSSNLARLTDQSHSYGRSRSNSFSNYPDEVSVMPGGSSSHHYGREMRISTHSLDGAGLPVHGSLRDSRTSSLPRVTTAIQPQIVAQPDILVNTMPSRSRSGSRGGTLTRTPAASLAADNSHDYYMHLHRQKFKEEKRKHRFNLQTVMLIGCYALLVMVAIVIGVVVCYQNGWLGLGPPQSRTGDSIDTSNSIRGSSADIRDRRKIDSDFSIDNNVRNRHRNQDSNSRNSGGVGGGTNPRNRPTNNENRNVNVAGFLPSGNRGTASGSNQRSNANFEKSLEKTRATNTVNHKARQNPSLNPTNNRRVPTQTTRESHPRFPNLRTSSSGASINTVTPKENNNQNSPPATVIDGIIQIPSQGKSPTRQSSVPQQPRQQTPRQQTPRQQPPRQQTPRQQPPRQQTPRQQPPHQQIPRQPTRQSIPRLPHKLPNPITAPVTQPSVPVFLSTLGNLPNIKLDSDTEQLTTQELLDLLAIRRMRDLLNSEGNTKNILDILSKIEPSKDVRIGAIKEVQLNSPPLGNSRPNARLNHGRSVDTTNVSSNQLKNFNNVANLDSSFASINSLSNKTVEAAILNILKERSKFQPTIVPSISNRGRNEPELIQFPVNKDQPSGSGVTVKDIEVLQRLLALNNGLRSNSVLNSQPASTTPTRSSHNPFHPRIGVPLSNSNPSINFVVGNRRPNSPPSNIRSRVPVPRKMEPLNPVLPSQTGPKNLVEKPRGPDPAFAVHVKTDGLRVPNTPKSLNPVFPPGSTSHASGPSSSTSGRNNASQKNNQSPVRELVAVKPGISSNNDSDVIRAWTHMDSTGILSRGRVLSDGSFTFTNCRPVEICKTNQGASSSNPSPSA